jgi:hypothetical protein
MFLDCWKLLHETKQLNNKLRRAVAVGENDEKSLIQTLISKNELASHDLKEECFDNYNSNDSELIRWLDYKLSKKSIDSDSSHLAVAIQCKMVNCNFNKDCVFPRKQASGNKYEAVLKSTKYCHDFVLRGDTITSTYVVLIEFLKVFQNEFLNSSKITLKSLIDNKNASMSQAILNGILENAKDICLSSEMSEYIKLANTVGNQILTPKPIHDKKSFNTERVYINRGSAGSTFTDLADVMLYAIYNYYHSNKGIDEDNPGVKVENITLKRLLGSKGISSTDEEELIKVTKCWLNLFDENDSEVKWQNFVKQNSFEPFVEENNENGTLKYGKPKLLWHTHTLENKTFLKTPECFKEFLSNSNQWIKRRGEIIQSTIRKETL